MYQNQINPTILFDVGRGSGTGPFRRGGVSGVESEGDVGPLP